MPEPDRAPNGGVPDGGLPGERILPVLIAASVAFVLLQLLEIWRG